jgi:hypothetical protein
MKKWIAIISLCIKCYSGCLFAQDSLGVFDSVFNGIPDTVTMGSSPAFIFEVSNTGNAVFNDSIQFNFYVDSTASGNTGVNFHTYSDGPFTLTAFLTDTVTTTPVINASFRGGINTVVIWPAKIPSASNVIFATDTIRKNIFVQFSTSVMKHPSVLPLQIFPNPVTEGYLSLKTGFLNSFESVRILDAYGKEFPIIRQGNQILLPVNMAPGIYFIEGLQNNVYYRGKFINKKD